MNETIFSIKPPFNRQGNKYKLRHKIIPLIPAHKTYVEPFVGSGAIFFNKQKAENNVLNDLDENTINRIKLLKTAPSNLDLYRNDLNTLEKLLAFYNTTPTNDADRLLREKIIVGCGFGGRPVLKEKDIWCKINPYCIVKHIPFYKQKLENIILSSVDYEDVIKKYDGEDTFFFLDPPYENTRDKRFGYAEDKRFDFERLARVLGSIRGKFMMTINDSDNTNTLFYPFNITPIDVAVPWPNGARIRKELLITNY
jgi:DNA adenine methylase